MIHYPHPVPDRLFSSYSATVVENRGSGMSMSIRVSDLDGLLAIIEQCRATQPAVAPEGKELSPRAKAAQRIAAQDVEIGVLRQLVQTFAAAVEEHPEMSGVSPAEVVDAMFRQEGVFPDGAPPEMLDVLASALDVDVDAV